jgi:hypothetical protein
MVLDAAKGIEEQTRKLFEGLRLRDVPIITFVNKLDREGRDPFDPLDEIEQSLALLGFAAGFGERIVPDLVTRLKGSIGSSTNGSDDRWRCPGRRLQFNGEAGDLPIF